MIPMHLSITKIREIKSYNSELLTFIVNLEAIVRTTVVSCEEEIYEIATAKQELWDLCAIVRSQKWR